MNIYFLLFESGAIGCFLYILLLERKNKIFFEILILAFFYGIVLEMMNIHFSGGAYFYSEKFLLDFANIPFAIGAGWSVVYYLSYKISQNYNLRWWQFPFLMSLVALSYDLVIDVVAIRLGFWGWRISFQEEWFGVPYENFFGWMVVVWVFAFTINLSFQEFFKEKKARLIRYSTLLVAPLVVSFTIISFVNFSALISGSFSFSEIYSFFTGGEYNYAYNPQVQNSKAGMLLVVIMAISTLCFFWIRKSEVNIENKKNKEVVLMSFFIHLLFLFFILFSKLYVSLPILIFISLCLMSFNAFLEIYPYLASKKDFMKIDNSEKF